MSLIFGSFAHVYAAALAVPIAIAVTVLLMWVYRFSGVQRIVFPGADECRTLENVTAAWFGHEHSVGNLTDAQWQALSRLGHGILIRNGLNAVAVAIIFMSVFAGAHALLMSF